MVRRHVDHGWDRVLGDGLSPHEEIQWCSHRLVDSMGRKLEERHSGEKKGCWVVKENEH